MFVSFPLNIGYLLRIDISWSTQKLIADCFRMGSIFSGSWNHLDIQLNWWISGCDSTCPVPGRGGGYLFSARSGEGRRGKGWGHMLGPPPPEKKRNSVKKFDKKC